MIYLLVYLIITAYILNILSKKYSLDKLSYKREIVKKVVEIGEEFDIRITIENRKILPVSFLQVKERLSKNFNYGSDINTIKERDGIYHLSTMMVMPYQRIKRSYKIKCSKRGRHMLYDVSLIAGDILGLESFRKDISLMQSIIVLPKSLSLQKEVIPYGDYMGDLSVKRWIINDPVLTIGIREYTGFEPQKNIHWPSSLRTNKLMVKQFDYTSDNRIAILLNIECFKPFWFNIQGDKIERCISFARAVIEQCQESGIPYGLITNGYLGEDFSSNVFSSGWGRTHFEELLEVLGSIDYGISMPFEETLSRLLHNRIDYSTYVIITPSIFEEYLDRINALNRKCQRLVVISLEKDKLNKLDEGIISFVGENNKH